LLREYGAKHLFDDAVGSGWCIVAKPGVVDALPTDYREAWKAFGGRTAIVSEAESTGVLEDVDGTYAAWFAAQSCSVAVIRPDWYVYGTARDGRELVGLLDLLAQSLHLQEVRASA